jgi:DNA-binding GntR family transcriptional regulator
MQNMDSLTPSPTLIDQTYGALLAAICDGRLQPGERLNQDEIAARLRISRQPVGQALSILKAQGFVRDTGRRGLIVAPLEREFFRAIYQLREALDPMAARLAAERCSAGDIADARKLLAEGKAAVDSGSIAALVAADMSFHMWIYQVAGNPLALDTMRLYWNHLRRAMGEVLRDAPRRSTVWSEHEHILQSIIDGDGEAAARHALRHARDAAMRVAESLPATQARAAAGQ